MADSLSLDELGAAREKANGSLMLAKRNGVSGEELAKLETAVKDLERVESKKKQERGTATRRDAAIEIGSIGEAGAMREASGGDVDSYESSSTSTADWDLALAVERGAATIDAAPRRGARTGQLAGDSKRMPAEQIEETIASWKAGKNYVAAGNLGEHVTLRLLDRLGYTVLATQNDVQAAVSDILGYQTQANPEDFIAVDKQGRLLTVNAKAMMTPGRSVREPDAPMRRPRISREQRAEEYVALRGGLISPLDGGTPFAQVVHVDLIAREAQVFEIGEDLSLTPVGDTIDVSGDIAELMAEFAADGKVPPPAGPNR